MRKVSIFVVCLLLFFPTTGLSADLFERIFPSDFEDQGKIAVHYFYAALADYATGNTTKNQIMQAWALDTEAEADLDVILGKLDSLTGDAKLQYILELHAVMMIAESGLKYDTKASFKTRMDLP